MNVRIGQVFWLCLIAIIVTPALCLGAVKGLCSDCHTMHNSQEGQLVAFSRDTSGQQVLSEVPFNKLLKTDCVGCHSDSGSETILTNGLTKTPIVLNFSEPAYPPNGSSSSTLAGGNFHWVAQLGDQYGHNVYGISDQDSRFVGTALAPGSDITSDPCASCHMTLATEQTACNGCHVPRHHASGSSVVTGTDEGWYRFLGSVMQRTPETNVTSEGVTGIEDPNWEVNPSSTLHNTYQGTTSPYSTFLDTKSVSQKCAGCHGLFHNETLANSVWIRHPVDVIIPNTEEFSGLSSYNPLVPVARQNVNDTDINFSSVTLGSDVVSCISCHRPHGSPYPAMLRWAYRSWPGNDPYTGQPAVNGCAICHTTKD